MFLGWLFGEAFLRVEGVGAEGLVMEFLDFVFLLVPGPWGCLFRAGGNPFVRYKQLCCRFWLFCFYFVFVFVVGLPFFS